MHLTLFIVLPLVFALCIRVYDKTRSSR